MKKGQATYEFIRTYGLAILVVLVAIGALAYSGVLDYCNFDPTDPICQPYINKSICGFQFCTELNQSFILAKYSSRHGLDHLRCRELIHPPFVKGAIVTYPLVPINWTTCEPLGAPK